MISLCLIQIGGLNSWEFLEVTRNLEQLNLLISLIKTSNPLNILLNSSLPSCADAVMSVRWSLDLTFLYRVVCFVCCHQLMMLWFLIKKRTIFQWYYSHLDLQLETWVMSFRFRQSEVVSLLMQNGRSHLLQLIDPKPNSSINYDSIVEDDTSV